MNELEDPCFVDMNNFMQTELREQPWALDSFFKFQCEICTETFGIENDLINHQNNCPSTVSELKCAVCQVCFKYGFKSKRQFRSHLQAHMNVDQSSAEQNKMTPKETFSDPNKSNEEDNNKTVVQPSDLLLHKEFQCTFCEKSFNYKPTLINHVKTHSEDRPFPCNICDKQFKFKQQLQTHTDTTHNDERPFACDICKKSFKLKQQLQCHQRIHLNYRPFPCEQCNKSFKLKQQLQNHMVTHMDERPFQCLNCDKSFKLKQQLLVHCRVHDKLKLYECEICGKEFSLKQNLNVHLLKHREDKPFKCEVCKKGFATKQNLTVHMKVHIS